MRSRVRVRNDAWTLSPRLYWILRRSAPLVNLVGMAAGGLLLVRVVLVFGVANGEYSFGPDIPIAALLLLIWALLIFALARTPSTVLAALAESANDTRALVGPLQSRSWISIVVAVPVVGLICAMTPFLIPVAISADEGPEKVLGLFMSAGTTIVSVLFIWCTARSARRGVELTSTFMLAYGYLRSQRILRDGVVRVDVEESGPMVRFGYFLMRIDGMDYCLRIIRSDGAARRLVASTAPQDQAERGARLIRAWAGIDAS